MNTATTSECDIYLRLSDKRVEDALDGREAKLRAEATRIGWTVRRVIIENDLSTNGQASAFKRKKIITPSGRAELRTVRPGFRDHLLPDIMTGVNLLAEDLDRTLRQPRDGEDLLDALELSGASARSLSGSLTLTDGGTNSERLTARIMAATANHNSADKAWKVAQGRERWAGKSYGGGRRPFGYRIAKGTEEHQRTLIIDQAEEKIIRDAARGILDQGLSLKALARDLRERGVPTVTGAAWTASTLRDILSKPAVAGLAVLRGEVIGEAPWEPILDQDVWQRLVDLFESRRTRGTTSPEPRWLVSLIGTCGICGAPMKVTGSADRRAYVCRDHGHLRRDAVKTDQFISGLVVARLSQPDVVSILRPPPRQGTGTTALRDQLRKLGRKLEATDAMFLADQIDAGQLARITKGIRGQMTQISAQLAVSDQPDALAEFRDRPAAAVWESLSVARRRAVVRALMDINFMPAKRRGYFDPESIAIIRKV